LSWFAISSTVRVRSASWPATVAMSSWAVTWTGFYGPGVKLMHDFAAALGGAGHVGALSSLSALAERASRQRRPRRLASGMVALSELECAECAAVRPPDAAGCRAHLDDDGAAVNVRPRVRGARVR
jgi:hypothetical protein